jgi:hypothetical protein
MSGEPRRIAPALAAALLTWASPAAAQRPVDPVRAFARVERARVSPGDTVGILVTLELAPGFHVWPHQPVLPPALARFTPVATDVSPATLPAGARLGRIDWPEAVPVTVQYVGPPLELLSYTGTVVARVVLTLRPDATPGRATVTLRVRYQPCDDRVCHPPADRDLTVRFRIVPAT